MPPASQVSPERARKNETLVLHHLARVGLEPVAEALGVDDSTVSRLKGTEIPRVCKLLARLGLKIVPEEYKCYPLEHLEALRVLANAYLAQTRSAAELAWEDE